MFRPTYTIAIKRRCADEVRASRPPRSPLGDNFIRQTETDIFSDAFPEGFIDVRVAEAKLMRVAGALPRHGLMVFGNTSENNIEVTLLTQKARAPRRSFLELMNSSALGSIFTRYESSAWVSLEFKPTFTTRLLKDTYPEPRPARQLGVAAPVALATREVLEAHCGALSVRSHGGTYLGKAFETLTETLAQAADPNIVGENIPVATGLEQ